MYKTNFYMIIRRLLFLLFIVAVHIPAEAQVKNINITVRRTEDLNSKDAAPWPGVIVYGFFNASKANAFMKKCQEEEAKGMTYAPQSESEYDALGETDQDGYCLMQLPLTGYIIVKPEGATLVKRELRGMMDIKVTCLAAKQMGTVTKTAKRKRKNEPQIPNMCGNRMVVGPFYYYLSADDTDDKSRIIVSPVVKAIPISEEVNLDENEEEGNGEIVGHLVPFVKDGEQFQKGNLRRMGFDETRDPLFKYREGTFPCGRLPAHPLRSGTRRPQYALPGGCPSGLRHEFQHPLPAGQRLPERGLRKRPYALLGLQPHRASHQPRALCTKRTGGIQ